MVIAWFSQVGRGGGLAALLACAAVLVSGCGTSAQDAVKNAFNKFIQERSKGDPAACNGLSRRLVQEQSGKSYAAGLAECRQQAGSNKLTIPKGLKVDKVTVNGNSANLTASAPGQGSATFGFVKEGGDWKVDTAPGA